MLTRFIKYWIEHKPPRIVFLIIIALSLIFGYNTLFDHSVFIAPVISMIINFFLLLLIMGSFLILIGMLLIRSEWDEHVH